MDLSEEFATLNHDRMGAVVRNNTRQNQAPRMLPNSDRTESISARAATADAAAVPDAVPDAVTDAGTDAVSDAVSDASAAAAPDAIPSAVITAATAAASNAEKKKTLTAPERASRVHQDVQILQTVYPYLSAKQRDEVRRALFRPSDSVNAFIYTRPRTCMAGSSLLFLAMGILVGHMLLSSKQVQGYRGAPLSAGPSKAVDRLLRFM